MKLNILTAVTCGLCVALITTVGYAQRGMGENAGVARQATRPEIVSISGTVREVTFEPCQQTTGRALAGVHVLMEDEAVTWNVHLGPWAAVNFMAEQLDVGTPISVDGFRTTLMQPQHLVAVRLTIDGAEPVELRDADLRPFWAGGGVWRDDNASAWGRGRGAGMGGGGRGPGRGRGAGGGRGRGPGGMGSWFTPAP
jgi:hypothetical protein